MMGGSWLLWGRAYSFFSFLSISASLSPSITPGRDPGDMTSYDQRWLFLLLIIVWEGNVLRDRKR
jgi:hypothetical protein